MRRQAVEKLGIKEFTLAKNQRISPWVHYKQGIFLAAQHEPQSQYAYQSL